MDMGEPLYRVVPDNQEGGWRVIHVNRETPESLRFENKADAIAYARRLTGDIQGDLEVIDQEGFIQWDIDRDDKGAKLEIWDETGPLPKEVQQALQSSPEIKGIPQGQIQPKGKKPPKQK